MDTEIWKSVPIAWVVGYEISAHGRLRSVPRFVSAGGHGGKRWVKGMIRNPTTGDGGYLTVNFWNGKQCVPFMIHRLVAAAFIGPRPDGLEACHNDGVCTNNHVDNLRYDTHKNNGLDASRHGLFAGRHGENNARAILTGEDDVREIRRLSDSGVKDNELSARYGLSVSGIRQITKRRTWKHVA